MRRGHFIEKIVFDVGFATNAAALAAAAELGRFANGPAIAVIGKVFDDLDDPGGLLRIESLEIDLPPGPPTSAGLEKALREALGRYAYPQATTSDRDQATTVDHEDYQQLWHWLTTGTLPERFGVPTPEAIDELVQRVLASHGKDLARRLRDAPAAAAFARIARQWTLLQRMAVLHGLGGEHLAAPRDTVADWHAALATAARRPMLDARAGAVDRSVRPARVRAADAQPASGTTTIPSAFRQLDERARAAIGERGAALRDIGFGVMGDCQPWRNLLARWNVEASDADLILELIVVLDRHFAVTRRDVLTAALIDHLRAREHDIVHGKDLAAVLLTKAASLVNGGLQGFGRPDAIAMPMPEIGQSREATSRLPLAPAGLPIGAAGADGNASQTLWGVRPTRPMPLTGIISGSAETAPARPAPRGDRSAEDPAHSMGEVGNPKALLRNEERDARRTTPAPGSDAPGPILTAGSADAASGTDAIPPARPREAETVPPTPAVPSADAADGTEPSGYPYGANASGQTSPLSRAIAAPGTATDGAGFVATPQRQSVTSERYSADQMPVAVNAPTAVTEIPESAAKFAEFRSAVGERIVAEWPAGTRARLTSLLDTETPAATGSAAIPIELQRQRTRLAAQLAAAKWDADVWRVALRQDAAWLAAELKRHGAAPAWRGQLAAWLEPDQFSELISLWLPARDVGVVTELVEVPAPWLAVSRGMTPERQMRQWAMATVLCHRWDRIELNAVIAALVAAGAAQGDIDPGAVAKAIAAALPASGNAASAKSVLEALANVVPPGPLTPEWLAGLPRPLPPILARLIALAIYPGKRRCDRLARLDDRARRDLLVRIAPVVGAAALAELDRQMAACGSLVCPPETARWNLLLDTAMNGSTFQHEKFVSGWRAMARAALRDLVLSLNQSFASADAPFLQAMLDLWNVPSGAAGLLLDLVTALAASRSDRSSARLSAASALLDHLIATPGAVDAAAAADAMWARISPGSGAGDGASWPAAVRMRLAPLLTSRTPAPPVPADMPRRAGLGAILARAEWPDLVEPFRERDGPYLVEHLRSYGANRVWRARFGAHLTDRQFQEVLELWLPAGDAALLTRLIDTPAAWQQDKTATGSPTLRDEALAVLLLDSGAHTLPSLTGSVMEAWAAIAGRAVASVATRLIAALPDTTDTAALRTSLHLAALDGNAGASGYILDRRAPAAAAALPDEPFTREWLDTLRLPLSSAWVRAIAAALSDPRLGAGRLSDLDEPDRRRLICAAAPGNAARALATIDRLTAQAVANGLSAQDVPCSFAWRVLVEALFTGRPFSPDKIAAHWSAALGNALDRATASAARPPPSPFSSAWLAAQPARLQPCDRLAHIAAAAANPALLDALNEAEHRTLMLLLAPMTGQTALAVVDAASRLWRAAGWPDTQTAATNRRVVFNEIVLEHRPFDALNFAIRWFEDTLPQVAGAALVLRAVRPADVGMAALVDPALLVTALGFASAAIDAGSRAAVPTSAPATGTLVIANAGLVLVGAYIPMLFRRLDLVRGDAFVDPEAAGRGVHLLQHLVDGAGPALEPMLVLNKLLCGVALSTPLSRDFAVTEGERAAIDSLLTVIIKRWTIIGSTSIDGLRRSFLQRRGTLAAEPECWRLTVDPGPFDMLIEQLPWGFKMQKLPWMEQVLHVDWR